MLKLEIKMDEEKIRAEKKYSVESIYQALLKLDDHIMLVKSSGFQLADVSEQVGYSRVDYRKIVEYFREYKKSW